ncbi:restriction endonuclease subunit S (plasmid) [Deinococcus psychrotolerans]|uniref:Restriction endonuclease subunit S n=1 Tax=Deinococcus psychrotolerans TaxID=2489213 RepID=A0A3G8YJB5_9DEIO|nr:restriction endonuclease subunit S [Deinococcus psychrotolerans]AZI45358.1 restriction endonuclease subunit S [Deinococcus psychrotolerans]
MKNDLAQFPRLAPPLRLSPPLAHTGRVAMSDVKTVPEGWTVGKIQDVIGVIESGKSVNGDDRPLEKNEKGVLKVSAVSSGYFVEAESKAIWDSDIPHARTIVKAKSILFARASGSAELVGANTYVNLEYDYLFLPDKIWQIQAHEGANTLWLFYLINTALVRNEILESSSGGSGMKNVSQANFLNVPILLPPLPEQHKIAAILSAWDDALATLAHLIDTKRQQKRALAEQLLTGKRRLKGFEGEWKTGELGQFSSVEMGSSPSSSAYNSDKNGLPLIQGNADIKNRIAQPRTYTSEITRKCEAGDIILSVRAPVGQVAITFTDACIGRGVASIRAKEDQDFMYQLLIAKENSWGALIQGSTFESVTSKEVKSFLISLPPLPEQQAIASVLSTLDAELSALTRQQAAVQQQKRGLMDLLLTGRVRVKVDDLQTGP